jgi:hypothetical protein
VWDWQSEKVADGLANAARSSDPASASQFVGALIVKARKGVGKRVFGAECVHAFEIEAYAGDVRNLSRGVFIDDPGLSSARIRHGAGEVGIDRDLRPATKLGFIWRASRKPAGEFLIALGEVAEADGDLSFDVLTA